jgi:hypothetical protein
MEINCDAPPYPVVQACQRLGIRSPEDVRWRRLSQVFAGEGSQRTAAHNALWKLFFGWGQPAIAGGRTCTCGQKLPELGKFTFTYRSGKEATYLLGQCRRCLTIFWDEG